MTNTTDWNAYYARPYKAASLTRAYTASRLTRVLQREAKYAGADSILELGGANSCFIEPIAKSVKPRRYDVLDNNRLGLDLLSRRIPGGVLFDRTNVAVIQGDLLTNPKIDREYAVVFSVGLIEHFDRAGTERMIDAHFAPLRPRGLAIITFPTPTLLYRLVRATAEATGQWIFHDERPIRLSEVEPVFQRHGDILAAEILWPLILTQYFVAVRKAGGQAAS